MTFLSARELQKTEIKPHPREMSRLDKLREEMVVPWKELNKLAVEIVGREIKDVRFLTVSENRQVIEYMRANRLTLMDRYRKMIWNG